MNIQELRVGEITDLGIATIESGGFSDLQPGAEINLMLDGGTRLHTADGRSIPVSGIGQRTEQFLQTPHQGATLAAVVEIRGDTAELRVWRFAEAQAEILDPMYVYADKGILATVGASNPLSEWFSDEFALPPGFVGTSRYVISGGMTDSDVIRVYGRKYRLDFKRAGQYTVTEIEPMRAPFAPRVVLARIDLTGNPKQATIGESALTSDYLAYWRRYSEADLKLEEKRATKFDQVAFEVQDRYQETLELLVLDSHANWLEVKVGDRLAERLPSCRRHFTVTAVDADAKVIQVELGGGDRGDVGLNRLARDDQLKLEIQTSGTAKSHERRSAAFDAFARGEVPNRALLDVVNDKVPTTRASSRRYSWSGDSPSIEALFAPHGPTSKQKNAIEYAINSKDVVIIQGPPGTGKTRVVAAIAQRVAELGSKIERSRSVTGSSGRRILLASGQHDAVDVMASRTRVNGFPTFRALRRHSRGQAVDPQREWIIQTQTALRAKLDATPSHIFTTWRALAGVQDSLRFAQIGALSGDLAGQFEDIFEAWPRETAGKQRAHLKLVLERLGDLDADPAFLRALVALPRSLARLGDDGAIVARRALAGLDVECVKVASRLDDQKSRWAQERDALNRVDNMANEWTDENAFVEELLRVRERLLEGYYLTDSFAIGSLRRQRVEQLVGQAMNQIVKEQGSDRDFGIAMAQHRLWCDLGDEGTARKFLERHSPVLAATCQAAANLAHLDHDVSERRFFRTVIIDEAARINPMDLLIPLALAEDRVVLVGDQRQLGPYFEQDVEEYVAKTGVTAELDEVRQSPFNRMFDLLAGGNRPRTVSLDEQFRMHPDLGNMVSRAFYEPDLVIKSPRQDVAEFAHGVSAFGDSCGVWVDVTGERDQRDARGSRYRDVEVDAVMSALRTIRADAPAATIGVVTFYKAQEERLRDRIEAEGIDRLANAGVVNDLLVGTVDAFQGREFDIVILSTVRSPRGSGSALAAYGHLAVANRLCVALSRQRNLLVVVGDRDAILERGGAERAVRGLVEFSRLARVMRAEELAAA